MRTIYRRTLFPEMKADWRAHLDNSGHRDSPGCFRCYNDEMLDAEADSVTTGRTTCHAILGENDEMIDSMDDFDLGRAFVHPEDWNEIEEFTLRSDCHTGGVELYE